ncbi:MAG TPA: hypothetical protein VNT51_01215 [Miltoncostaeaceae bacterium]|nr:hypothetical protein [Miltoncostaeaceae bacterium]
MGLFDIIRGQRAPKRADLDQLFALPAAALTLEAGMDTRTTGDAGVCLKPVEAGRFEEIVRDLDELLQLAGDDAGSTISRHRDSFGFLWVVISDPDLNDLVTATHMVSRTMEERGFSEQLLCAVFGFRGPEGPLDLVYAYKRGRFYPFVPRPGQRRDNALEMRLQAALGGELPMEPELERWYPVWDAPVHGGATP